MALHDWPIFCLRMKEITFHSNCRIYDHYILHMEPYSAVEKDLSIPTANLARTFKVTLPCPDNTTYRNELQHVTDSLHPGTMTCYNLYRRLRHRPGSRPPQITTTRRTTTRLYTKVRTKFLIIALFFKQS